MEGPHSVEGHHPVEAEIMEQLHVLVTGLVQGVNFRHGVYRKATALELTGWVRNLADGRVEACFEGPRAILEDMLKWCHHGPSLSEVTHVESNWDKTPKQWDSFRITF